MIQNEVGKQDIDFSLQSCVYYEDGQIYVFSFKPVVTASCPHIEQIIFHFGTINSKAEFQFSRNNWISYWFDHITVTNKEDENYMIHNDRGILICHIHIS